ncbi:hypothetical protein ANANG_G00169970 [Anguilla anguilla]|uniref:Uncharacterized protein n=1 Tax=Anguilla anguilla TaxID=7936 RepID=A0A9D3RSY6_ANGAN|nr:hypothetical protein ANANG_G00169970 [Anguilla anguilla]
MLYPDYRTTNPAGTAGGAGAGPGGSERGAAAGAEPEAGRGGCFDDPAPSRLSHSSYAQFNTFTRAGQPQQAPPNPAAQTAEFPGDCGLLDSSAQLAYDSYGPTHYPYRLGFAPPMEGGPSYEMYGAGAGSETVLGKYGTSARFSYTSPPTDYTHRHTQRMQTHV